MKWKGGNESVCIARKLFPPKLERKSPAKLINAAIGLAIFGRNSSQNCEKHNCWDGNVSQRERGGSESLERIFSSSVVSDQKKELGSITSRITQSC